MDSLPTGDVAPGAVDNGSGTVALLVLAKAFAQFSWNRTIEFVAFGAEVRCMHVVLLVGRMLCADARIFSRADNLLTVQDAMSLSVRRSKAFTGVRNTFAAHKRTAFMLCLRCAWT